MVVESLYSVKEKLLLMQDAGYKKFHAKLMPTVSSDKIIGVRVPALRKFAKSFFKTRESIQFLNELPHHYYEENNLHAFLIEEIKDYKTAIYETNRFLPYVDNWATCDMFSPKVFANNKEPLYFEITNWLKSDYPYVVRYAIGMLMRYYIHDIKNAELVCHVRSDNYYVNMMKAWYFATALSVDFELFLPYISQNRLDKWVHNKTIQKAIESYRITSNQKTILKKYRIGRG